jgi:hypothetical protein
VIGFINISTSAPAKFAAVTYEVEGRCLYAAVRIEKSLVLRKSEDP